MNSVSKEDILGVAMDGFSCRYCTYLWKQILTQSISQDYAQSPKLRARSVIQPVVLANKHAYVWNPSPDMYLGNSNVNLRQKKAIWTGRRKHERNEKRVWNSLPGRIWLLEKSTRKSLEISLKQNVWKSRNLICNILWGPGKIAECPGLLDKN